MARFRLIQLALFLTLIVALAPPVAGAVDEPSRFFPETGHSVTGPFLAFFQSRGGIDTFGFPRTGAVSDSGRKIQYFQRARFEWWPENPPGYQVQLGLLGSEQRSPMPATASEAGPGPVRFFAETGHTVGDSFLQYWETRGALDVFGLPITPELVENGRTIQYFQRTRFEWHPENPAPYRVLLGLLGDEVIAQGRIPSEWLRPAIETPTTTLAPVRLVYAEGPGGAIRVVTDAGTRTIGHGLDPALSPDGRQVAFSRWDHPAGIYIVGVEGGESRLVYAGPDTRSPSWSRDGRRIAFYEKYPGYQFLRGRAFYDDFFRVMILDTETGLAAGVRDQTDRSFSPSFSPDDSVVFHGERGLYVARHDRLTSPLLVGPDTRFQTPAWSPDGHTIAFAWESHDHWEIGLVNSDGKNWRLITRSPAFANPPVNSVSPAWTPDGSRIVFLSDRGGSWRIYSVDGQGGDLRLELDAPIRYEFAKERVVSPGSLR
ncbi:MAG TPA: hypothetical protein VMP10_04625 [Chloroflexota bacterium]|nr:hypothetical protein [Chloroflexota bacterium]